ncbi:MAG: DUF2087 domain-containing protein [Clostridiales bacterium]|nr:DUF2087 domain-containing protein [Clostridiales bacterium]
MEQPVRMDAFLTEDGRIKQLPKKRQARLAVLACLARRFEPGRIYSEKEVNLICDAGHTFGDCFLLRRELVDHGLLGRTPSGSRYWRVAQP